MNTEWVTCSRCSGSGFVEFYAHVEGGICYECNGQGGRTAMRATANAKARARREAKREEERIARLRSKMRAQQEAGVTLEQWAANAFDQSIWDGVIPDETRAHWEAACAE